MKFEKLAEVKANYDVMLKRFKPDEHADKIEKIKAKKEAACQKVKQSIDAEKKSKIEAIKEQEKVQKQVLHELRDSKLEMLQSQEQSRRKTVKMNKTTLQTTYDGSSSTADISGNNINIKQPSVKLE